MSNFPRDRRRQVIRFRQDARYDEAKATDPEAVRLFELKAERERRNLNPRRPAA